MSVIVPFFEKQIFFLTGVTGFLGKVVLHKILTTCPNLGANSIYVLVRGKKNMNSEERFNEDVFHKSPLFTHMAALRHKIKVVEGDISKNKLGLTSEAYNEIAENCSIIIHMAATVSFNEKLLSALELNTFGPMHVLKLGMHCKRLRSIVFTSTCYVNSNIRTKPCPEVGEKIYPMTQDPVELINEISKLTREAADIFTSRIVSGFPNTYTFTKCLAEHALSREKGDLPICILRPSIIGPSWRYPVIGWVDSYIGPTGLALASGLGALRIMQGNGANICDIVPVDFVTNSLLLAAYHTAINPPPRESLPIYQCASSKQNPCTWRKYVAMSCGFWARNAAPHRISRFWGNPWTAFVQNKLMSNVSRNLIGHTPAIIGDLSKLARGQKASFMRQVVNLHAVADSLAYFTSNEWLFSPNNLLALYNGLTSSEDRELFDCDLSPRNFSWEVYVLASCRGTNRFLLKEEGPPTSHIPKFTFRSKL